MYVYINYVSIWKHSNVEYDMILDKDGVSLNYINPREYHIDFTSLTQYTISIHKTHMMIYFNREK